MANIELVIRIPEEYYKAIMEIPVNQSTADMLIIKNGTALPKGHGRLIDADELELDADWDDYYDGYMAYSESMIKYAPTIIEADTESEVQQ